MCAYDALCFGVVFGPRILGFLAVLWATLVVVFDCWLYRLLVLICRDCVVVLFWVGAWFGDCNSKFSGVVCMALPVLLVVLVAGWCNVAFFRL